MTVPFIRSPYNYDVVAASLEAAIPADQMGESLTIQSHAEDADINVLMKRFGVTGQMPQNVRVPEYGDYSGVSDFRSALEAISLAEDSFMQMPAEVRSKFQNNPQHFLDFCSNPANIDAMRDMGLAVKKPAEPPPAAPPAVPPQAPQVPAAPGAGPKTV